MCRIFASVDTADRALNLEAFSAFAVLADTGAVPKTIGEGHRDGWGIASVSDQGTQITKGVDHPRKSTEYQEAVTRAYTDGARLILGHLRKASMGVVSLENVQPFEKDGWIFLHNGTVRGIAELIGKPLPNHSTDSKEIFTLLLNDPAFLGDPAGTYQALIEKARTTTGYYSLTSLLTNGKTLLIVRDFDEDTPASRELAYDQYYTLYLGKNSSGKVVFVSSEPLQLSGITWSLVENKSLTVLDLSH